MHTRRTLVAGSLAFAAGTSFAATPTPALSFQSSALADYLHLLFFRAKKERFKPFNMEGFKSAPQIDELVAVPEAVSSAGLTRYDELAGFVADAFAALPRREVERPSPRKLCFSDNPPKLDEVQAVIAAGAPYFAAFQMYWRSEVAPHVIAQIEDWRRQDAAQSPLDILVRLHRLPPIRAARLQVCAMPFHPAGSANYSPAAVYTSVFKKADLGRVLGHEASHLMWSSALGTDWKSHPQAASVASAAKLRDIDVEEAMCMHMQFALSKAMGLTEAGFSIAQRWENGGQKQLLLALEAGWEDYLADPGRWPNSIDYVLTKAAAILT